MMSNKLQEVTDKICELLRGTELDPMELKVGSNITYLTSKLKGYKVDAFVTHIYPIDKFGNEAFGTSRAILGFSCISRDMIIKINPSLIKADEILMSLGKIKPNSYLIDTEGYIYEQSNGELDVGCLNLTIGKPLTAQSPETIESLHQILI